MDYRDVLEIVAGFILGIVSIVVISFLFVLLVDFKGFAVRIEPVGIQAEKKIEDSKIDPTEDLIKKFREEDPKPEPETKRYEYVEICINGVLHYKTSNGGITQRWNLNGTLISCDFGEYNKKTMAEPDEDVY